MTARTLLLWLLRMEAFVLTLAFIAIFLSDSFMDATHVQLGLGEYPNTTLVRYLTRSLSLLYATRGLFVWLATTDLDRYRDLILLIGTSTVLMGATLLGIDLQAGLPAAWTWMEGPSIIGFGLVVVALALKGLKRKA